MQIHIAALLLLDDLEVSLRHTSMSIPQKHHSVKNPSQSSTSANAMNLTGICNRDVYEIFISIALSFLDC